MDTPEEMRRVCEKLENILTSGLGDELLEILNKKALDRELRDERIFEPDINGIFDFIDRYNL